MAGQPAFSDPVPHVIACYCFPGGSDGKESACIVRDLGSILGQEDPPGEGNGYPVQYSCLENPMDRGAWGLHD